MNYFKAEFVNTFYVMRTPKYLTYLLVTAGLMLGFYLRSDVFILRNLAQLGVFLAIPIGYLDGFNDAGPGWRFFEEHRPIPYVVPVIVRYLMILLIMIPVSLLWIALPLFDGDYVNIVTNIVLVCGVAGMYFPIMYAINPKTQSFGQITLYASFGFFFAFMQGMANVIDMNNVQVMVLVMAIFYVLSLVLSLVCRSLHRSNC